MMTCNNNNNNMLIIVMLLLITLMNTQIYAIGQEAIDAGLSETATSTHFKFFWIYQSMVKIHINCLRIVTI